MAVNLDFETPSLSVDAGCVNHSQVALPWYFNLQYSIAGAFFGLFLIKAEVVSWYRIQEMFRLQSFHMYGVIGSAVAVGALSVWIIKKWNVKTVHGESVVFDKRPFSKGQIYGGLMFGLGWAMTGACPGPIYALIGSGMAAMVLTWIGALAGAWIYGFLRDRLPH